MFNTSCINIAETASQSSTYRQFDAYYAVDRDNSTFSRTQNEQGAWLEVDLGEIVQVCSIGIQNRWCKNINDPKHCLCRLSGATLSLIDELGFTIPDTPVSLGNSCDQLNLKVHFDQKAAFCSASVSDCCLIFEISCPRNICGQQLLCV